jgi:hypothetical protein
VLELERQKAQRLLGFLGNPFCFLELTGVLWSIRWRESGIPIITEKLAFKPLLEFKLMHLPAFLPSDASSQVMLSEPPWVMKHLRAQNHKFDYHW